MELVVVGLGRTIPSFRLATEMEKQDWRSFRNALDKKDRKAFDQMWDIPRLYITACSNSIQLVPLHPICISILFHHYKQLMELKAQLPQMSTKVKIYKRHVCSNGDYLNSKAYRSNCL
jgi:hypothetical protein